MQICMLDMCTRRVDHFDIRMTLSVFLLFLLLLSTNDQGIRILISHPYNLHRTKNGHFNFFYAQQKNLFIGNVEVVIKWTWVGKNVLFGEYIVSLESHKIWKKNCHQNKNHLNGWNMDWLRYFACENCAHRLFCVRFASPVFFMSIHWCRLSWKCYLINSLMWLEVSFEHISDHFFFAQNVFPHVSDHFKPFQRGTNDRTFVQKKMSCPKWFEMIQNVWFSKKKSVRLTPLDVAK